MSDGYPERYYVVFASSFRSDTTPCISHETVDKVRTLCGRKVSDAETFEPDSNNLEADCNTCRRKSLRLRTPQPKASQSEVEIEAQIKCEACAPGHQPGSLRKPCGNHGCECWCNR